MSRRRESLSEICARNPSDPRCPQFQGAALPGVGGGGAGSIQVRQMGVANPRRRVTFGGRDSVLPLVPPTTGGGSGAAQAETAAAGTRVVPDSLAPSSFMNLSTAPSSADPTELRRMRAVLGDGSETARTTFGIESEANTEDVLPSSRIPNSARFPTAVRDDLRRMREMEGADFTVPTATTVGSATSLRHVDSILGAREASTATTIVRGAGTLESVVPRLDLGGDLRARVARANAALDGVDLAMNRMVGMRLDHGRVAEANMSSLEYRGGSFSLPAPAAVPAEAPAPAVPESVAPTAEASATAASAEEGAGLLEEVAVL